MRHKYIGTHPAAHTQLSPFRTSLSAHWLSCAITIIAPNASTTSRNMSALCNTTFPPTNVHPSIRQHSPQSIHTSSFSNKGSFVLFSLSLQFEVGGASSIPLPLSLPPSPLPPIGCLPATHTHKILATNTVLQPYSSNIQVVMMVISFYCWNKLVTHEENFSV